MKRTKPIVQDGFFDIRVWCGLVIFLIPLVLALLASGGPRKKNHRSEIAVA